jgi:hypothetical protein
VPVNTRGNEGVQAFTPFCYNEIPADQDARSLTILLECASTRAHPDLAPAQNTSRSRFRRLVETAAGPVQTAGAKGAVHGRHWAPPDDAGACQGYSGEHLYPLYPCYSKAYTISLARLQWRASIVDSIYIHYILATARLHCILGKATVGSISHESTPAASPAES